MAATDRTTELKNHLAGVDFPADKDPILRNAKAKDAPGAFRRRVAGLEDREWRDKDDVVAALGVA